MLCEALTFTGLRDELPRLMAPGHTIMAPTNEAWAKMDESVRKDPRLVRQLLLGHMCAGISTLQDLRQRLRPLRPALPASSAHLRRDVQLGFRRRLRRRRPRLGVPPGPRPTALWTGPFVICSKVTVCVHVLYITRLENKSSKVRAIHHRNDKRQTGEEKPAVAL